MKRTLTPLDLELAAFFYAVLIEVAKANGTITYRALRERTKADNPASADLVDRCANKSVGRRLEVVRMFTSDRGYPDLTSLVLNKHTGEVGGGFVGDAKALREEVHAFDWDTAEPEFNLFVADLKAKDARRAPRLSEEDAKALMVEAATRKGFRHPSKMEFAEILERIRRRIRGWRRPCRGTRGAQTARTNGGLKT